MNINGWLKTIETEIRYIFWSPRKFSQYDRIEIAMGQENSKYPIAYYWARIDMESGVHQKKHDTPWDVYSGDRQSRYGIYQ